MIRKCPLSEEKDYSRDTPEIERNKNVGGQILLNPKPRHELLRIKAQTLMTSCSMLSIHDGRSGANTEMRFPREHEETWKCRDPIIAFKFVRNITTNP